MPNRVIVKGNIGNALHSVAPDHITTTAYEVFDETQQQYQDDLNAKGVRVESQEFTSGQKTQALANLGVTIGADSDFNNPTEQNRAKIPTVGAVLDGISEGVFNLTAKTGDSYASLQDALTAANTAIPDNKKKGGMQLIFVQSSDNKYVQYRLMTQDFSTTESDWQGVDDEPIAGSKNLVESDGVDKYIHYLTSAKIDDMESIKDSVQTNAGVILKNGSIHQSSDTYYKYTSPIELKKGQSLIYKGSSYSTFLSVTFNKVQNDGTFIEPIETVLKQPLSGTIQTFISIYTATENCYIAVNIYTYEWDLNKVYIGTLYDIWSYLLKIGPESNRVISGKDLFTIDGKYINSNGNLNANASFSSTELFNIGINDISIQGMYSQSALGIAFYTENKTFISGISNVTNLLIKAADIPSTAKYIRFSTDNSVLDNILINFKSINQLIVDNLKEDAKILGNTQNISEIQNEIDGFPSFLELLALTYSKNIFIVSDCNEEGYLDANGELKPVYYQYGWMATTHFVNIYPSTSYTASKNTFSVCFYKKDFTFISQSLVNSPSGTTEITSPSNAYYARFSTTAKNNLMFAKTSEYPESYEEGGYPIADKTYFGLPLTIFKPNKNLVGIKYAAIGDSITYRNHYQQIIDDTLGTTHINYALSGGPYGKFMFHQTNGDYDRLLVASDFSDCDFILICGYANSVWSSLGSMNDTFVQISQQGLDDADSISAYIASIASQSIYAQAKSNIDYITRICPNKPIICAGALPMNRKSDGYYGEDTSIDFHKTYIGGATARQISDAIKEVSEWYSIPYIDMERNGQVNINNYTEYYDAPDLVHPNFVNKGSDGVYPNSGMKRMATLIMDSLHKVVAEIDS